MTLEDVPVLILLPCRDGFLISGPNGVAHLGWQWWVNAWVKAGQFGACLRAALRNPTQELER
jgi:hypothetical protein